MYRPINAIRFYEKPINFGGFCNAVERVLAGGLEDNAKVTGLSVSEGPVD